MLFRSKDMEEVSAIAALGLIVAGAFGLCTALPLALFPAIILRWIGAEENYVRICTQSETHLLRETMSRLEEKLDPQVFLRVHRSSIVNLQFVKEVRTDADGECMVVLVNGQKVAMSRSYRSRIQEWLHR